MVLALMGSDSVAARQQVDALRGLSEAGLPFGPWADSLASRIPAEESQNEEGLRQIREGMAAFQAQGTRLGRPTQLLLLAKGYAQADKAEAGLAALDEALAWMDQTGVRMLEAEAHRLRGELLLANQSPQTEPSDSAAAEGCFRRAIAVARRQEARWWELRAAVSLCRLLEERKGPQDASRAEAHRMLAEVYDRFSEGFEMPDLRAAWALLTEFSRSNW
jgi:predicted ATPase